MNDELTPKVSIIGCGNVGMRYAYGLLIKSVVREMVIVDIDEKRLRGEVADLSHGIPYTRPVSITAGSYADMAGSDLVVITAGQKQKQGQTRMDLARNNVALFRKIIPEIMRYAPEAIFLVVTNPLDVMSYAAFKLSGKPSDQVIGSGTVLDTARFRTALAAHCGIDARNMHAYILGEHGDTEFPVWSKAVIGGMLFSEYCQAFCVRKSGCNAHRERAEIFDSVKTSAYRIIEDKGETSYGIGLSMVRITQAIVNDENSILPVSTHMKDYFGIHDCYMSLPAVLNRNGVREILLLKLDEEEQALLASSATAIKQVLRETGLA